jgi:hypothetical protein
VRRAVVLAAIGVVIGACALLLRSSPKPARGPSTTTEPIDRGPLQAPSPSTAAAVPSAALPAKSARVAEPAPLRDVEASRDVLLAVRDAIHDPTDASTAVLVEALDSEDSVAKLEAIDELARRRHVPALKRLLAFDPADDPFVGPTALLAMGALARDADASSRESAVDRLVKLLEAEKERRGADSAGNVLVIFEALGKVQIPRAARALERELVDPGHGTASKVAIVDALEACGQASSLDVLASFRETVRVSAADPFERALEADLVTAVDRTLASLGRRR